MTSAPLRRFAAAVDAACAPAAGGPLLMVSGLGPGPTGVGRMVAGLMQALPRGTRILYRQRTGTSLRALLAAGRPHAAMAEWLGRRAWRRDWDRWDAEALAAHPRVLLIHPQTLGIGWTLDLIGRRRDTTLFAADASPFCLRSYNHRQGAPCLACVGTDGGPAAQHGCLPFPEPDPDAARMAGALRRAAGEGRLRLLTQNPLQDAVMRRHLGPGAAVVRVGLWSPDWDVPIADHVQGVPADIVFHGGDVAAKGSRWALQVAAALPEATFLFPFAPPQDCPLPTNARFQPCTWERGLGAAVAAARIVLVPSLWSAPIEGALVKSMLHGRLVATAAAEGCWSEEIPDAFRLRLDPDPVQAAAALRSALAQGRTADHAQAGAWIRTHTVPEPDQVRQVPAASSAR